MERDEKREIGALINVLNGTWGTIGPNFCELIDKLGKEYGTEYALVTFSSTAALEAALRGLGVGCGDEVLVCDKSSAQVASVITAVGADFSAVKPDSDGVSLCARELNGKITGDTKAVIAELTPQSLDKINEISKFCREKNLYFVLYMGDCYGAEINGRGVATYADAAVLDMSEGTAWNVGYAGALLTRDKELFDSFFAFHNCGRPFGEGCSLSFGNIIGGDLRVDEWQACLIASRLGAAKDKRLGADPKNFVTLSKEFCRG